MKQEFFYSLYEILQKKQPVLMATIISQHGSSPRGTGARMAITADKHQIGTIGGGRLEAILHDRFEELISSQSSIVLDFILSESEAANLEMICGGSISVLVDPILPENTGLIEMYEKIHQIINSQKHGWLISLLPDKEIPTIPQKCFFTLDQNKSGTWLPDINFNKNFPENLSFQQQEVTLSKLDLKSPQILTKEKSRIFFEPIGQHSTVYIVGAGHIAQKLAPLTSLVGFRTVILDDREDFICAERFPGVDGCILLENFDHVFQSLRIDSETFIVIVTRGHHFDKSVLYQAIQTQARYIGMIGSRRKIKLTFEALNNEGVSDEDLAKVHSPIGLAIGAETPEEIAVSIVAELIQIRSQTEP
jgi:xanthine dehydrogenase accessory factor